MDRALAMTTVGPYPDAQRRAFGRVAVHFPNLDPNPDRGWDTRYSECQLTKHGDGPSVGRLAQVSSLIQILAAPSPNFR